VCMCARARAKTGMFWQAGSSLLNPSLYYLHLRDEYLKKCPILGQVPVALYTHIELF
jgi:hypothetical protein